MVPRQFSLDEWNQREYEFAEKKEELESLRDMLNAAIEELISKNKSLESTLDELTKRNSELDQLIYRLSHDLKTPITSILGLCQLMKLEGLPLDFFKHINHVEKQGQEMVNLLSSLSAFSDGVLEEVNYQLIYPKEILTDVLKSLSSEPGYNEITFEYRYCGINEFSSDREKVFLIFRNIIKNAIHFKRSNNSFVRLNLEISKDKMTFVCTDNGIGIPAEIQKKIFGMFYRGSEKSKGNGMGLYLVNELLKKLEGTISLESNAEQTCFTVCVPFHQH